MGAIDGSEETGDGAATRLGVVGAGYVGLTNAACLAHLGHRVVCGDSDPAKVELLNGGAIPVYEAGLAELVTKGRATGALAFVEGAAGAAAGADIVFLCVPTPRRDDGGVDLSQVEAAARQIAAVLQPGAVVVTKSTVPVGSTTAVEAFLGRDDVTVVSNPEFLREGTAVADFLGPDRVVIGAWDRGAAERVAALYAELEAPVLITDPASAELIKYAANGFLAMKVSYVNAIATMCEAVGADVRTVIEGLGGDLRIGHLFLEPGPGWGGSCFAKDSRALVKTASDHGYDFAMMRAVVASNDDQRQRVVDKIAAGAGRTATDLRGVTVGALGLTFKAGTDDLRESPALAILGRLREAGAEVRAFDPTTCGPLAPHRAAALGGIEVVGEAVEVGDGADVLAVFTEWPEFRALDLVELARRAGPGVTVVDTRGVLDPALVRRAGLRYDGHR